MRRACIFLLLIFAALPGGSGSAWAAQTLLVLSDGSDAYERTATRIRERMSRFSPELVVQSVPVAETSSAQLASATLVVTIGTQAATDVIMSHQPDRLICALLTHQTYDRMLPPRPGSQRTAVFIDQPASRQIALIKAALPQIDKLALVYGDASVRYATALSATGRQRGLDVRSARVDDSADLYNALRDVLDPYSALIAVPDNVVYNNFTIQNILLTAYRQRTPVIGFSPAYVRAGAVAAVYSTPEQVGDQVASIAIAALQGVNLPPPAYPTQFSVSTNTHVAHSLSIELPTPAELEARILATEGRRP